jgi:hypothetical protein
LIAPGTAGRNLQGDIIEPSSNLHKLIRKMVSHAADAARTGIRPIRISVSSVL